MKNNFRPLSLVVIFAAFLGLILSSCGKKEEFSAAKTNPNEVVGGGSPNPGGGVVTPQLSFLDGTWQAISYVCGQDAEAATPQFMRIYQFTGNTGVEITQRFNPFSKCEIQVPLTNLSSANEPNLTFNRGQAICNNCSPYDPICTRPPGPASMIMSINPAGQLVLRTTDLEICPGPMAEIYLQRVN